MANFRGGMGGAATGAAIGSVVPVIGTGIGAGIGALAGLFGGPDKPDLPDIYWSEDSLRQLEEAYPELYQELIKGRVMVGELAKRADQMANQGMSPAKAQMLRDEQDRLAAAQSSSGELGSLVGTARHADLTARMTNQFLDADKQAALQAMLAANQAQQSQFGQEMGMNRFQQEMINQNIQRAMQRDAAINARNMMEYQQGMEDYNAWGSDLLGLGGALGAAVINPYTAPMMGKMGQGLNQGMMDAWNWMTGPSTPYQSAPAQGFNAGTSPMGGYQSGPNNGQWFDITNPYHPYRR